MSQAFNAEKISNFRLYRELERGEFIVVFVDTAQGGIDKNYAQFMSKTRLDVPLVFSMRGVAAEATPYIHQALEWIYDKTGIRPVVAYERQAGGASEMHTLMMMNRKNKYELYHSYDENGRRSDKLGWDTTNITRPNMVGEWKVAFEAKQIKVYDLETIEQHSTFVTNNKGKPEADTNSHDDGVMSIAGAFQLFQTEAPPAPIDDEPDIDAGIGSLIY